MKISCIVLVMVLNLPIALHSVLKGQPTSMMACRHEETFFKLVEQMRRWRVGIDDKREDYFIDWIRSLCKSGLDTNYVYQEQNRPLHLIVQVAGVPDVPREFIKTLIRILIICGADKTLKNWDDLTPADLARHNVEDEDLAQFIESI